MDKDGASGIAGQPLSARPSGILFPLPAGDDGAAILDEVKPDARRARVKIGFHSLTTQCHGLTALFDIDNHYQNKVFNNDLQDATR
ncbi:TPA: hypothetical protein SMI07_002282 [Serratia liquefaciens]|nr:hypothetical protein [Serratia liquefaciens]